MIEDSDLPELDTYRRVEIYKVDNPREEYPTSAIRIVTEVELTPAPSAETRDPE
jgi:hypothetical protein